MPDRTHTRTTVALGVAALLLLLLPGCDLFGLSGRPFEGLWQQRMRDDARTEATFIEFSDDQMIVYLFNESGAGEPSGCYRRIAQHFGDAGDGLYYAGDNPYSGNVMRIDLDGDVLTLTEIYDGDRRGPVSVWDRSDRETDTFEPRCGEDFPARARIPDA